MTNSQPKLKPSRWYYLLSAALISGSAVFGVLSVLHFISGICVARMAVPGAGEINVPKPGSYTINYEHNLVAGNETFPDTAALPDLRANLIEKATSQPIALQPDTTETYHYNEITGHSLWKFTAPRAGAYILTGQRRDSQTPVTLAVSKSFFTLFITQLLPSVAIQGILFLGGFILALVTLVRRIRNKKKLPPPLPA